MEWRRQTEKVCGRTQWHYCDRVWGFEQKIVTFSNQIPLHLQPQRHQQDLAGVATVRPAEVRSATRLPKTMAPWDEQDSHGPPDQPGRPWLVRKWHRWWCYQKEIRRHSRHSHVRPLPLRRLHGAENGWRLRRPSQTLRRCRRLRKGQNQMGRYLGILQRRKPSDGVGDVRHGFVAHDHDFKSAEDAAWQCVDDRRGRFG